MKAFQLTNILIDHDNGQLKRMKTSHLSNGDELEYLRIYENRQSNAMMPFSDLSIDLVANKIEGIRISKILPYIRSDFWRSVNFY